MTHSPSTPFWATLARKRGVYAHTFTCPPLPGTTNIKRVSSTTLSPHKHRKRSEEISPLEPPGNSIHARGPFTCVSLGKVEKKHQPADGLQGDKKKRKQDTVKRRGLITSIAMWRYHISTQNNFFDTHPLPLFGRHWQGKEGFTRTHLHTTPTWHHHQ